MRYNQFNRITPEKGAQGNPLVTQDHPQGAKGNLLPKQMRKIPQAEMQGG
jgi:hypothetical protein